MDSRRDLLQCLLVGLPEGDQQFVVHRIERAHDEQLDRKRHPPRRRRRNADGMLELPPPRDEAR